MRYATGLVLFYMLTGCANAAPISAEKPTGEQVFDLLINNSSLSMKSDPLCDGASASRNKLHVTLGEVLSTNLSVSYDANHVTTTKSYCNPSKFETNNKIIDVWDCSLEILENDKKGEFISSSIITFSTNISATKIIPGSIRCF